MIDRRTFVAAAAATLAVAALATAPGFANAQQQRRVPRIAYLSANPAGDFRSQAFREGLRDFGYTEGKDIVIEYFLAPTIPELPQWAAKAVASNPDVILAVTSAVALAAMVQTTTIPIVFTAIADPVATGLVASIARPGGNATGPSTMNVDLAAKRLQMLSEFVPGIARVTALYDSDNLAAPLAVDEILRAGKILNIQVRPVGVRTAADLAPAIASAVSEGAQAIQFAGGPFFSNNAQLVADETLKHHLPSISDNRIYPDSGGLIAYGANFPAHFRRAAYYVDRILKGARPGDLPVEQSSTFEFVINLKTAKALGLTIPPSILLQATEVIE